MDSLDQCPGDLAEPAATLWPGDPDTEPRGRGAGARAPGDLRRRASRLARAIGGILTPRYIAKGLRAVLRGDPAFALRAAQNLTAQRLALAGGEDESGDLAEPFRTPPAEPGVPLVSIVIPCVNHGAFVAEAVASALAQTFPAIEVIVVDGGSDDGTTPAAVAALAGPRVRVILREGPPKPVGDNRNCGVAAARGRYICCLDADDVLDPTYIEKCLFVMEQGGFDVVGTSLVQFGARSGEWRVPPVPTLAGFALHNQTIVCAMFRTEVWRRAGGYSTVTLLRDGMPEDWEFWFRLAVVGARFRNISGETLLRYRVRAAGSSLSNAPGAPPPAAQRRALIARHGALLTRDAIARSARQSERRLRPADPHTPMAEALAQDAAERRAVAAPGARTVVLAMSYFHVGGAERLLSQVAAGLAQRGWRVIVVATGVETPAAGDSLPWFAAATAECYALNRFLPRKDWRRFMLQLLRTRRPDVVVNAGSHALYGLLPETAAEFPRMAQLDLLFNVVGHVEDHLARRPLLTGALCENREVLAWLTGTAGWSPDRVAVIPSGVDTVAFTPGPRPARVAERLGIGPSDIVVGWGGRMAEEKAPEIFVDLAARCADLPGVHFVMTGSGPLAESVAARVADLPASVRFHNLGLVDDVREYYHLYDVYTLTSRLDGRPQAVMEAQSSGCAVLASRIGGVPEIVAEGVTGWLAHPADAADFERVLRAMLADRAALASMREAATVFAREEFSMTNMAEGYRRALEAAVGAAYVSAPPG